MCTQPPLENLIFASLGALRCTYADKLRSLELVPKPLPVIQCCAHIYHVYTDRMPAKNKFNVNLHD